MTVFRIATDDLLDLDMSGQNTLTNIMAMHNARSQQQQSPFGQPVRISRCSPRLKNSSRRLLARAASGNRRRCDKRTRLGWQCPSKTKTPSQWDRDTGLLPPMFRWQLLRRRPLLVKIHSRPRWRQIQWPILTHKCNKSTLTHPIPSANQPRILQCQLWCAIIRLNHKTQFHNL